LAWQSYVSTLSEWLGVLAVIMLLGISPAFRRAPIGFRYPRREVGVSVSLFTLLYVIAFQFYARLGVLSAPDLPRGPYFAAGALDSLQRAMILAAIGLAVFIAALALRGQPLRSLGWGRAGLGAALRMGLGVAIMIIFLRGKGTAVIDGLTGEEGTALLFWLGLALAEETIFRGYLQPRLTSLLGDRWGWLAAAGLSTLWYLPGRLGSLSAPDLITGLVLAAVQGLLLSYMMKKTQHAAAPALVRAVSGWLAMVA